MAVIDLKITSRPVDTFPTPRQGSLRCTLEVWQDMIHVLHFFASMLREGRDVIGRVGKYCRHHLKDG